MNLYKKCTEKPFSFLVMNTTLLSDNPICLRKKLSKIKKKKIMRIDDKIRHEKLQYDINREAGKILALSNRLIWLKVKKY